MQANVASAKAKSSGDTDSTPVVARIEVAR
jgi:hypothetical protein